MSKFFVIAVLALCFITAGETFAQSADRATTLAAELDKTKHKKKEKKGFSFEFYTEVRNTPAVKENAAYSGIYSTEGGEHSLNLSVAADGQATGSGHDTIDGAERVSYKLVNGRVSGAVLTATKAYSNGRSEPFEAVFVNRKISAGKNPSSIETSEAGYGLGYIRTEKDWTSRVFLSGVR